MTPASLYLARRRTSHKRGSVIYEALPLVISCGSFEDNTPPPDRQAAHLLSAVHVTRLFPLGGGIVFYWLTPPFELVYRARLSGCFPK